MLGFLGHLCRAARAFLRDWMTASVAIASLAVGMATSSTMFAIVDYLVLRPPPLVRAPEQIVRLRVRSPIVGGDAERTSPTISYPLFTDLRRQSRTLSSVGAYWYSDLELGVDRRLLRVPALLVSDNYFAVLGIALARGSFGDPARDADRRGIAHAVISWNLWQSQFGGRSDIVGTPVRLNGREFTIVGVTPHGVTGLDLERVDIWAPIGMADRIGPSNDILDYRPTGWLSVFGRLRAGVSRAVAARELSDIVEAEGDIPPDLLSRSGHRLVALGSVRTPQTFDREREANMAIWVTALAMLMMAVACANVGSLILARALRRAREFAVRLSLGAGRRHLFSLLAAEGVALATAGVATGAGLITLASAALTRVGVAVPAGLWSGRVLAWAALLGVAVGLGCSFAPAGFALRADQMAILRTTGDAGPTWTMRVRELLAVMQIALSVCLLGAAASVVTTYRTFARAELGYDAERLITVAGSTSAQQYTPLEYAARVERARLVAERVPGIVSTSVGSVVPFGEHVTIVVSAEALAAEAAAPPHALAILNIVDTAYFRTLGIALRRGRAFDATDRTGGREVAIVGEALSRQLWGATDPIGKCVHLGMGDRCVTVVGSAGDVRLTSTAGRALPVLYVPITQRPMGAAGTVFARFAINRNVAAVDVERALGREADAISLPTVRSIASRLDDQVQAWRMSTIVVSAVGVIALALAGVGLYGALSFTVSGRAGELGIRASLGAPPVALAWTILRRVGLLAMVGGAFGWVGAGITVRILRSYFTDLQSPSPTMLAGLLALLCVAAGAGGAEPGLRAARTDAAALLRRRY